MRIADTPDLTAEKYLALPWTWHTSEEIEEGEAYWVVTIEELPDFFAAGRTEPEAMLNYRDALLSLLRSYLATGKEFRLPRSTSYRSLEMAAAGSESYCFA